MVKQPFRDEGPLEKAVNVAIIESSWDASLASMCLLAWMSNGGQIHVRTIQNDASLSVPHRRICLPSGCIDTSSIHPRSLSVMIINASAKRRSIN